MELSDLFEMGRLNGSQSLSIGELPQSGYRTIMIAPAWFDRPVLETCTSVRTNALWRPAENCHLWLWTPSAYLKEAMKLMEVLGFKYITSTVWVKGPSKKPELLLVGRRGRPFVGHHLGNRLSTTLYAENSSRIPDVFYEHIETVSDGPYLEIFSQSNRNGWHSSNSQVVEVSV